MFRTLKRAGLHRLGPAALAGLIRGAVLSVAATSVQAGPVATSTPPPDAQAESFSLSEARNLAQQAFMAGQAAFARALALRLVEIDPRDVRALLILSASATAMGDPAEGRKVGRQAWLASRGAAGRDLPPGLRHEIARHTALAAWQEGRLAAAQLWLRRAAEAAPDKATYDSTVEDFRHVRRANPLRYAINLAVTPMSNLNGGASSGNLTVDDWFYIGPQTGTSLALSGTRSLIQAQLTYALPASDSGQTTLGLRGFGAFHALSSEAKAKTGGLSGRYLNTTSLEASLRRDRLMPGSTTQPLSLTAVLGHSWEGGLSNGPHLRLEAETPLLRRSRLEILAQTHLEWQDQPGGDVQIMGASLAGSHMLSSGRLGWELSLREVDGPDINQQSRALSGQMFFEPGQAFGPVRLRGSLSLGLRDFPAYRLGAFRVVDGREDTSLALSLDILADDLSILGHAPRLSLNLGKTESNISRFATEQIGLSLGLESRF